jgi:hypothetical protein
VARIPQRPERPKRLVERAVWCSGAVGERQKANESAEEIKAARRPRNAAISLVSRLRENVDMSGDVDALCTFVAKSGIFANWARCVRDPTPETVRAIDRGILFVMALWSGPSHRAFAELKAVIERLNAEDKLELVVVDTDTSSGLEALPEMKVFHGAGETFWIPQGRNRLDVRTGPQPGSIQAKHDRLAGDAVIRRVRRSECGVREIRLASGVWRLASGNL